MRNEFIATSPPAGVQLHAVDAPVSGLYLIQLKAPLQPAWREQLGAAGVVLLRYVPDDAFIARLGQVRLSQVRSMPFVQWVGEYRADYRIHTGLIRRPKAVPLPDRLDVRLLLAPDVSGADLAGIRRFLQSQGGETRTRFGTILQGKINLGWLSALAQSAAVLWIEPAPAPKLYDEVAAKIVGGENPADGHATATQALGFDGRGVTVAVADSGLHNGDAATMHPDLAGRVDAFFHYGNLTDAADEHSHGTHVAGIVAGNGAMGETDEYEALYGLGVAPGAHIVAQRIFDGEGKFEPPPSNAILTRDAVRAGAVIGSNSWGDDTQGRYDLSAAEFDALVRDADPEKPGDQPYILEFSAGNAGPGAQTVGSPAVAKNVIATGASQNNRMDFFIYDEGQEAMADFSSRGPCEDGRIKPDAVAPGTWIASLQSASASDEFAWMPISPNYLYQGGTSQAGPHVSGAAAVFVQYYRETHTNATPSPALVKAALINAAVDMEEEDNEGRSIPNNDEGWGRVDLTQIIGSPRRYDFVDQTIPLTTGQSYEHRVVVGSGAEPLKITLVYTDVPGLPAAIPALVNDLDLEVVGPGSLVYHGNQIEAGESAPNAPAADSLNNVEAVHLRQPLPGEYLVRVRARNVVEDARSDTPAIDQDFALVTSADLPLPGVGVVVFDRRAYTAPDRAQLELIDFDLAGQPTARLLVTSRTEPNGEWIVLQPKGPNGVFTGSVVTVIGTPASDGRLQVSHGDAIEASYQDASPAALRQATARADLVAPLINNVAVTNRFGKMIVSWTTDEPANSVVCYGTNMNLPQAVTNPMLSQNHSVALEDLENRVTYRFFVASADEAGNTTTNDNQGRYFSFVALPAATVLLVDAYVHGPDDDSIEIPVAAYTDALDQIGISYEVWNVAANGSPPASNLRLYRVVAWRINDSFYDATSLSAPQQTAIQDYLKSGGSFFMASMEILSRLGNVPFRTNVLQVQEFVGRFSPFDDCPTCDEDHGVPAIQGLKNDPITSGMYMDLDYSLFPAIEFLDLGPDFSDTFRATTNASPIFLEPSSSRPAGMRYPRTGLDTTGRVVFLSFPLETVPMTGEAPNNRVNLLRNALAFLAPGSSGLGNITLDRAAYTVPSLVTVEVADADLAGQGQTDVKFYSDLALPDGVAVILQETVRRGLFRGFVTLVAVTNAPAPGQLPARHGSVIWAEYFDASSSGLAQADAEVDTIPPAISDVTAEPEYEDAVVSWSTSEPTDALVQFGESTFLGRTAYFPDPEYSHELVLTGLQPDRLYFYQVVSRDAAGNATVDNNNGQLHTFHTWKPLRPPWFDGMEQGSTNWTTFDGDETEATWQQGMPNNGREIEAHSPLQAWGSNLNGDNINFAQTFLIGPAISLIDGNRATLRFWHSYDFTEQSPLDILEVGQVLIVTNGMSQPILLKEYGEASNGWELEEIDLTPYLGHMVYLAWYYELFSLEFDEVLIRPGWLVDDVSITTTNIAQGAIQITNNLAQASFTMTGPATRAGSGWNLMFTNMPAGTYTVTFTPVPFYQTPAPQTNQLGANQTLVFAGRYGFADANANGISDPWEQQYFGVVSPARNSSTDTDGDRFADYAEFVAGTNPTNANSALLLLAPVAQTNHTALLSWPASIGHAYRLQQSTNALHWAMASGWIIATNTNCSLTLPLPAGSVPILFRLEVRP